MGKKEEQERIFAELRTLDAKLEVLAQKIKTIEKNEEVLGRTLLAVSAKLKKIEQGGFGGGGKSTSTEELDKKYATKSDLAEMRYVVDAINPLDYATISQVRDLVDEKLEAAAGGGGEGGQILKKKKRAGNEPGSAGLMQRI